MRLIDAVGVLLGTLSYKIFSTRRRIVRRNLRIAWGDQLEGDQLEEWTKKNFQHTGANLLGGMRCMLLDDDELRHHVSIEGAEIVQKTLQTQQSGVIFALCHMGNWETLARVAKLISPQTPAAAFYRPLNNPWMNRMTKRRRERSGTRLFSNQEGFNQSVPLLRNGGMLGILSDQHAGRSGCMSTFFGRTTTCSPLAELLQRRTKCSLFYVSITRDAPAHWHISIRPHPSEQLITTPSIIAGLEESLSQSPWDGFWMHNRWKQPKKRPLYHPFSRESLSPDAVIKPWRWVFISSQDENVARAAAEAMVFAANTAAHTEVEILSYSALSPLAAHTTLHKREENLREQLSKIDAQKSYPIDAIVCFMPAQEMAEMDLRNLAPIMAGPSGRRKNGILAVSIEGELTDPKTWWDFISQLGVKTEIAP